MKLSIIIPSYKDPLLHNTVEDILKNTELPKEELEIIAVLDGYWYDKRLVHDERVRTVHLGKNRGMKDAINAGVSVSQGEYFFRIDEHCSFGKGFDRIILEDIQPNEVVVPRRYFLDPVKWEVMDIPYVDYDKLMIDKHYNKFTGKRWRTRARQRKDIMYDETMAMQGSFLAMKRTWWDEVIGELQSDKYGPHYGDSIEVIFKTWQAGGRIMVNKKTWYAHKHRDFPRTHSYSSKDAKPGWDYALEKWGQYYEEVIRPKWMI